MRPVFLSILRELDNFAHAIQDPKPVMATWRIFLTIYALLAHAIALSRLALWVANRAANEPPAETPASRSHVGETGRTAVSIN
jgi:hypothetical protein